MAYCMYLRKSRKDEEAEQRGEGETLKRHELILSELANAQGLYVLEIYRELVSGDTISSRPVMQRLISDIESNIWDGVLVMEVERLARGDTIDQGIVAQAFKYSGTKIITPLKTYDPSSEFDEEYFEFGLFMSRREYKTINRRLQMGKLSAIKEGKYIASRPPYGYLRVRLNGASGFTLEPNDEQADIVRMIFNWYAHGVKTPNGGLQSIGAAGIADKLNGLGIPPQRGNAWSYSSVRGILSNPVYAGRLRWNWRPRKKQFDNGTIVVKRPRSKEYMITEGIHPALIPYPVFKLVQERLGCSRPSSNAGKSSVRNPFAGIILCGECGGKLVRRSYKNQKTRLMCSSHNCNTVSSTMDLVEKAVFYALNEWLSGYMIDLKSGMTDINHTQPILGALQSASQELEVLQTQIDNVFDMFERGIYDVEMFSKRREKLNERLLSVSNKKNALEKEIKDAESANIICEPHDSSRIAIIDALLVSGANAKNLILKEIVQKIVYTKTENGRWHGNEDGFTITIYPLLPKANSLIDNVVLPT